MWWYLVHVHVHVYRDIAVYSSVNIKKLSFSPSLAAIWTSIDIMMTIAICKLGLNYVHLDYGKGVKLPFSDLLINCLLRPLLVEFANHTNRSTPTYYETNPVKQRDPVYGVYEAVQYLPSSLALALV